MCLMRYDTEVIAQDDTVTFKKNHASFSAFTYV